MLTLALAAGAAVGCFDSHGSPASGPAAPDAGPRRDAGPVPRPVPRDGGPGELDAGPVPDGGPRSCVRSTTEVWVEVVGVCDASPFLGRLLEASPLDDGVRLEVGSIEGPCESPTGCRCELSVHGVGADLVEHMPADGRVVRGQVDAKAVLLEEPRPDCAPGLPCRRLLLHAESGDPSAARFEPARLRYALGERTCSTPPGAECASSRFRIDAIERVGDTTPMAGLASVDAGETAQVTGTGMWLRNVRSSFDDCASGCGPFDDCSLEASWVAFTKLDDGGPVPACAYPELPRPRRAGARLVWIAPGGFAGWGPAIEVRGDGTVRMWDMLSGFPPGEEPAAPPDRTTTLPLHEVDELFFRWEQIDLGSLPHDGPWAECYPRVDVWPCEGCARESLDYSTAEQLAPEMECVWQWFDGALGGELATYNPRGYCAF